MSSGDQEQPVDSGVDEILKAVSDGDGDSTEQLMSLVYDELHRIASGKMRQEGAATTLQPTALVHEAWLRLMGPGAESSQQWNSRGHFFSAAAEAMRRILVEAARRRRAQKRGGGLARIELDESAIGGQNTDDDVLAVHEILDQLESTDPRAAEIAKLRFFVGLSMSETAEAMNISVRSAQDIWRYARAWLRHELRPE